MPRSENDQNVWSGTQFSAAIILTSVCLAIIILRNFYPNILLDNLTIYLIIIGALPWLTLFFKKFKLPGIAEAETHDDRRSATTEEPRPPLLSARELHTIDTNELSDYAKKILATLWKYQKQHFKDDIRKRWMFTVLPHARAYPDFLSGLSEVVRCGFVTVSADNNQAMLTNEGISFIEKNPVIQDCPDVYTF